MSGCAAPPPPPGSVSPRENNDALVAAARLWAAGGAEVPKIVHQTWKGCSDTLPEKQARWRDSCIKMNPGWSFWLWTDDDNRNLIKDHYPFFLNQYDAYDVKMKRIDSSRLFYIHRYGGVYLDLDFACLQPFDTLPMPPGDAILSHQYTKWLIRQMYGSENKVQPFKAGTIANNFMVAPRGHPLFSYAIRKLPTFANHSLLFATGPNFLSRMVYEHDQLVNHSGIKTHVTQYYLGRIYATGWRGGAGRNPCGDGTPKQLEKCSAEAVANNGSLLATFWTQTWKYASNGSDATLPLHPATPADSPPPPPPPAIAPPPPRARAASDGCSVDTAVDEAKVRKFLRMLRSPNEEDVQRDWWFRDVPLDVFTPYKDDVFANCHPRNGCYWLRYSFHSSYLQPLTRFQLFLA